jgi:hypothetical protein
MLQAVKRKAAAQKTPTTKGTNYTKEEEEEEEEVRH